jgi:hypothetical protein
MGIALLQLHIFTLQTLRGDRASTKSGLSGASGCKRWFWLLKDHLQPSRFRLAASLLKKHRCQHANLSLVNSHMDSFLDWSSSASSTELGWLLLIQKLICFDDRVLHKLATGLLLFLQSRNFTGTLPHLKRMRVELLDLGDLNSLKYFITKVLWGLLLLLLLERAAERWLTQGWFWENLLLIFSSLSSFHFSLLTASFFLFALPTRGFYQRVLPSYRGGNRRPCATVFNPRITEHCDLRGEGVENGVACYLAGGFIWSVLLLWVRWELRELVGGVL